MGSFLLLLILMVRRRVGVYHRSALRADPLARRRTMLRIAGRTMRPDGGLILRDAACAAPQDEGIES
jgi:hypothetical protein